MNPFTQIAQALEPQDGGLKCAEGTVLAASPLKVKAFSLEFPATSLMVNPNLMTNPVMAVQAETAQAGEHGAFVASVTPSYRPALAVGDKVLCLALGANKVYIINKVVAAR